MAAIPGRHDADDDAMLEGELPSAIDPPTGCRFHTRCPHSQQVCKTTEPEIRSIGAGHFVACHFPQAAGVE
jgi:oligopeptide/dipeptide ABC transporter ATP-binding protein